MAFDQTRANPNIVGNQNSVTTIVGDTFVGQFVGASPFEQITRLRSKLERKKLQKIVQIKTQLLSRFK